MGKHLKLAMMALSLIALSGTAYSQPAPTSSGATAVAERLAIAYNAKNPKAICAMFDDAMRAALPEDAAGEFFANLYSAYGAITKVARKGRASPFDLYKLEFEKGELLLKLAEDGKQRIIGLSFEEYVEETAQRYSTTRMALPFKGEWYVFWGGETEAQNYHLTNKAQRGAYDFLVHDKDGNSHRASGAVNEDYYAYGRQITAPCDGMVAMVVDGVPDNVPGRTNPYYAPGNSVMLRVGEKEFLLIGHMVPGSIAVRKGQAVKKGDLLGLCGNSGNSSEPHVHMHMQDREEMDGAVGLFVPFSGIRVNGALVDTKIVVKGESVSN